jgi:putative SOS response-associated peptidase YedK
MCGRVVAARPREVLASMFGVDEVVTPDLGLRWNVGPTTMLYAVAGTAGGARRLGALRWGLVPSWATDPAAGPRPINARVESLLDRPHFAGALATRRCLVPVDGFYEWRTEAGRRRPHLLASPDGSPLAIAAVWDRWAGDGHGVEPVVSCALVTTPAGPDVAPLHDRMPAIVAADDWDEWLDHANADEHALLELLRPLPAGSLRVRPASLEVNSTANDGPHLLDPPDADPTVPSLFE